MAERLYALDNLKNMIGDDEQVILEFVQIFIEQSGDTVEQMKKCLEEQKYVEVGKLSHKLKSSIDLLKIGELKNIIREAETIGKSGQHNEVLIENVSYIDKVMQKVISQLRIDFNL